MERYEPVWTFKTARFVVTYAVTPDYDLDLSWDEDNSTREALESGELQAFVARVSVTFDGRNVATDYLGECIYKTPMEFIDHRGSNGAHGSYFTDMVLNAIGQARATIRNMQTVKLRSAQ